MITTKDTQEFLDDKEKQKEAMLSALKTAKERVESGDTIGLFMITIGSPTKEQIDAGADKDCLGMQVFSGYPANISRQILQVMNHHIQKTLIPAIIQSAGVVGVLIPIDESPEDSSGKDPEHPRSH